MELLIPGLILVGLMVYASTRIKRSAARAFEAETVETAEFTLYKPDGFLSVLNGDPAYIFEAYSKDFGTGDDNNVRAARARIRLLDGVSLIEERNSFSVPRKAWKTSGSIKTLFTQVIL